MQRRTFLIALAFVAACSQPSTQPAQLTQQQFRDKYVALLKAKNPDAQIIVKGPLSLDVGIDGTTVKTDLGSGYGEYLTGKLSLDAILAKWVALAPAESGEVTEDIRTSIVYVVRSTAYLENSKAATDGKDMFVHRPLGGDLHAVLFQDSPQILSAVTSEGLKAANLAEGDAWKLADANLLKRVGRVQTGATSGDGPFAATSPSGLATGLLGHPNTCGPEAKQDISAAIFLLVDRDTFIQTLPDDPGSVERFWKFAKPLIGKGMLLSDTPVTCRNGKWEAVTPP